MSSRAIRGQTGGEGDWGKMWRGPTKAVVVRGGSGEEEERGGGLCHVRKLRKYPDGEAQKEPEVTNSGDSLFVDTRQ